MPLTEPLVIPLSSHQRARFARWQEDLERVETAVKTAQRVAVEMLVAEHMDPADIQGATFSITDDGLVITPPPAGPVLMEA